MGRGRHRWLDRPHTSAAADVPVVFAVVVFIVVRVIDVLFVIVMIVIFH